MKASEMIHTLENMVDNFGDADIFTLDEECSPCCILHTPLITFDLKHNRYEIEQAIGDEPTYMADN